jgi:hypothetical protein
MQLTNNGKYYLDKEKLAQAKDQLDYKKLNDQCRAHSPNAPDQLLKIYYNQEAFFSRSATNTLIIDCRGTPRRFASLSSL